MKNLTDNIGVPNSLRTWFVVHFVVDIIFAIPMMFFPVGFLQLLGWQTIDPIMTRMVAAALFAIGIESYLGRNASRESFQTMLNLKIIWSAAVVFGIGYSLLTGAQGSPIIGWVLWLTFLLFNFLWVYWRMKLRGEQIT